MPNIPSAKTRVLVTATKATRTKAAKTARRTAIKKADAAIAGGAEDRAELVKAAQKKIDQAAAKGLIHKNNAARKKSALAVRLNNSNA